MDFIIKEIRRGNKKAFRTFFTENYEKLVAYANGYLFDLQASEDVVQDVFIYIWENAHRLEITTSLKGYMAVMVKNRCINLLKSVKITDRENLFDLTISLTSENIYETEDNEKKEILYNKILKVLDTLPDKMQQIVKMKLIQGYKYQEIAKEMDISVNTVKTQLKRAKSKILQLITFLLLILLLNSFL
jgi:RNA polymerase sigma-70 factor (ECF subfamily)